MRSDFKVGDRVRFFQDFTGVGTNATDSPEVPLNSVGTITKIGEWYRGDTDPGIKVVFKGDIENWFYPNELELVDEEVDLPFSPWLPVTAPGSSIDKYLESSQKAYLKALSDMTTARKQLADLSLDRYLPEEARESLEEYLDKQIEVSGQAAELAIKKMSKLLGVE